MKLRLRLRDVSPWDKPSAGLSDALRKVKAEAIERRALQGPRILPGTACDDLAGCHKLLRLIVYTQSSGLLHC